MSSLITPNWEHIYFRKLPRPYVDKKIKDQGEKKIRWNLDWAKHEEKIRKSVCAYCAYGLGNQMKEQVNDKGIVEVAITLGSEQVSF